MFKRFALTLALVLGLALPVSAETSGVYAGLKFIDSIQSTGDMSKDRVDVEGFGFGIGSHSQNTVGGGIFVGYDFYPQHQVPIRTEIEYAIRSEMYKSWNKSYSNSTPGDVNLDAKARSNFQTLFFNAYWDFHNSTAFTPYIGAGVGLGFINNHYKFSGDTQIDIPEPYPSSVSMNNMNTVFAWNVGAGCSYAFNENFSADLAYRFVGLGYNETSKTFKENGQKVKIGTSPYANEFSLGLRYTF